LFDPIPEKTINDHINDINLIDHTIFNSIPPHIGYIEKASLVGDELSFSTSLIEFDKDTRIGWTFSGEVEKNQLTGTMTELFTPIYDESNTIKIKEVGKVQVFSKPFILVKIEMKKF